MSVVDTVSGPNFRASGWTKTGGETRIAVKALRPPSARDRPFPAPGLPPAAALRSLPTAPPRLRAIFRRSVPRLPCDATHGQPPTDRNPPERSPDPTACACPPHFGPWSPSHPPRIARPERAARARERRKWGGGPESGGRPGLHTQQRRYLPADPRSTPRTARAMRAAPTV